MLLLLDVGYRFPTGSVDAVRGVDLDIEPGEIVLLTGPTGCGKSTVLRLAAGLLARHGSGTAGGEVRVRGRDPAALEPGERVSEIGFVAQNPSRQIVTGSLGDEVAFGLESAEWTPPAIAARVPEMLARLGLPLALDRSTQALSGGQQQRLMVAAALAGGAALLLLDEPLAHLDPPGAAELMGFLRDLADGGVAVVLVEHRLEAALPFADRVVVMEEGTVVARFPARDLDLPLLRRLGLRLPGMLDLEDRLGSLRPPLADLPMAPPADVLVGSGEPAIEARGVGWSYPGSPPALIDVSLRVQPGERVAILGPNGSGKSTLLACLTGALPCGGVTKPGRSVRVPQDPDLALFCETVREELEYGPREGRVADPAVIVADVGAALSVAELAERAPQALSRGQRLRVAVAAALACRPDILVLDEPTSGQDHDQVERMMDALADPHRVLLFATHDVDLALRHATRVVVLDAGRVVLDATPAEAIRAMPAGVLVPPLARWCVDHGLAPTTAADAARRVGG